jgi:hypothetical protein
MKIVIKSTFNTGRRIAVRLASLATVLGGLFATNVVHANPRPLPFTYPYETLPEGSAELELYGDMTPLRVQADPTDPTKGRLYEPAYILQSEFEYGVTDRLELGFYQVFEANPQDGGSNTMTFDGFKWRVRGRLAEAGEWPVDVSLYLELETLHDEWALEEKVNLAKRFGRLRWMTNLWVEQEIERPFDRSATPVELVVNPTMGFVYDLTTTFHPGVEYWAHGKYGADDTNPIDKVNNELHHFVGPTVHLDFGKLWWSLGVYANLNNMNTPQPGETYGPVWMRTVLGIDL